MTTEWQWFDVGAHRHELTVGPRFDGPLAEHQARVPEEGWLASLNEEELSETAEWVTCTFDCPSNLAWTIADENDNGGWKETPEQRYERVLRRVQARIKVEA